MKYIKTLSAILIITSLPSCFNGRIILLNNTKENLIIETTPIIHSSTGSWENYIHYYSKDSITWRAGLGGINAKILKPNYWKRADSLFAQSQTAGYHFSDYSLYKNDSVVGKYSMYPNSWFIIGETKSKKKIIADKNKITGRFDINTITIYKKTETLKANTETQLWNLLVENYLSSPKKTATKRRKDIVISID